MNKEFLNVHIGEVKVTKKPLVLKALLGSCVGIAIIWRQRKVCGLAHCLLPLAPNKSFDIGGRFVNQAVASLLALMKATPPNYAELEVVVAGGGNMTSAKGGNVALLIGTQNSAQAIEEFKKLKIKISFIDIGGDHGRRIFLNAADLSWKIETIPRIGVAV